MLSFSLTMKGLSCRTAAERKHERIHSVQNHSPPQPPWMGWIVRVYRGITTHSGGKIALFPPGGLLNFSSSLWWRVGRGVEKQIVSHLLLPSFSLSILFSWKHWMNGCKAGTVCTVPGQVSTSNFPPQKAAAHNSHLVTKRQKNSIQKCSPHLLQITSWRISRPACPVPAAH